MCETAVKQHQEETDAGITKPTSSGWESKKRGLEGYKRTEISQQNTRKKIIDGDQEKRKLMVIHKVKGEKNKMICKCNKSNIKNLQFPGN